MRKFKVLTRPIVKKLNTKAIRLNLNQTLKPAAVLRMPNQVFPVVFSLLHNDDHMRVVAVQDEDGRQFTLDMTLEDFSALPEIEVPDEAFEGLDA